MGGGDGQPGAVSGDAPPATVRVRCTSGATFSVAADLAATVGELKGTVAGSCDVPPEQQRLIYKGRMLKDDQTLASYGLKSDHTIHLVRGAPLLSTPSTTATTIRGGAETPNRNSGAGFGGSLFPDLGVNRLARNGASSLLGAGFPDLDQMQQQLFQNPNIMREIMNMPVMQSLIINPNLIQNIIMSNPQMREIIDRNPDLAHTLNDPNTLRQTLEVARNPELMREMMRNTDRAMSNIESSPEGFNMLRRMYETVQEPLLNATTMGGEGGLGSTPLAALLGNQGATQTRNSSANPPTTSSENATLSPSPNTRPLPNPWSRNTGAAQSGNTRSSTAGGLRVTGPTGLGGLGLPDLRRTAGGLPDPSIFSQFIQNPAVRQMVQNFANPETVNQMLNHSPSFRSLLESNTQFREALQNPELIRQLMSPETLQRFLNFQQTFLSQMGRQQSSQQQNQAGGFTGTRDNSSVELLSNLYRSILGGGLNVPNTSNVPLEELYATQLSQLQEMGFFDTQENIRALVATSGNVHAAVERLLSNLGQ